MDNPITLSTVVRCINDLEPISMLRFDDGEWNSVMGKTGANCDGHIYYPEMGEELKCILQSAVNSQCDNVFMGLGSGMDTCEDKKEMESIASKYKWDFYADLFHQSNAEGQLGSFIEAIRNKKVMIVGPDRVNSIMEILKFNFVTFIIIPQKNCYSAIDSIQKDILYWVDRSMPDVILFSASMASECLIHRLGSYLRDKTSMLDVGSIWEPYCGHQIRSYHQRTDWAKNMERNLNGTV